MALPSSWAQARVRLAAVLGGGTDGDAIANEWITQALEAHAGVGGENELPAVHRGRAWQKLCGVLLTLEDMGDGGMFPFHDDFREATARVFARYFDGAALPGPPWRLSPHEDLPSRQALVRDLDDDFADLVPP